VTLWVDTSVVICPEQVGAGLDPSSLKNIFCAR